MFVFHLVKPADNTDMINTVLLSILKCTSLLSAKHQLSCGNKALENAVLENILICLLILSKFE